MNKRKKIELFNINWNESLSAVNNGILSQAKNNKYYLLSVWNCFIVWKVTWITQGARLNFFFKGLVRPIFNGRAFWTAHNTAWDAARGQDLEIVAALGLALSRRLRRGFADVKTLLAGGALGSPPFGRRRPCWNVMCHSNDREWPFCSLL